MLYGVMGVSDCAVSRQTTARADMSTPWQSLVYWRPSREERISRLASLPRLGELTSSLVRWNDRELCARTMLAHDRVRAACDNAKRHCIESVSRHAVTR